MAGKPAKAPQNGRGIWIYDAAKAPQISSTTRRLQDLRSSRLEAFTFERAIAADPDFSLLGRLNASQQPSLLREPSIKEQILHFCYSCRAPLHSADKHSECVSCLGTKIDMSLSSLRSRLASFQGETPPLAPSRPPAFYLSGPWDLHLSLGSTFLLAY